MLDIFDILGPVMVGPSSSHTAGAVRIGRMARTLLGADAVRADIGLHGSFADTGQGHGTDRALVAGLLGMKPDDLGIPESFEIAGNRAWSSASTPSTCGTPTPTRRCWRWRAPTGGSWSSRRPPPAAAASGWTSWTGWT